GDRLGPPRHGARAGSVRDAAARHHRRARRRPRPASPRRSGHRRDRRRRGARGAGVRGRARHPHQVAGEQQPLQHGARHHGRAHQPGDPRADRDGAGRPRGVAGRCPWL
ncbi:MAG: SSU ribosomal protein S5p (S2e), partial [uncultured Gemmatimonadetes bacterium]